LIGERGGPFERKNKVSSEIPSASMADIAFLLLIFFMVTTVFRTEKPRQWIPPEAQAQERIPEKRKYIQHLYVERDGSVYINDRLVPTDQVSDVMRPMRVQKPRLIIALRGDKEVKYDYIDQVSEELKEAGAVRVNFATKLERRVTRRGI